MRCLPGAQRALRIFQETVAGPPIRRYLTAHDTRLCSYLTGTETPLSERMYHCSRNKQMITALSPDYRFSGGGEK